LPEKHYYLLRPFLEYGILPVLNGTVYADAAILEISFLLFLNHYTRGRMKLHHLIIILFLMSLLTIGPVTASVAEFGYFDAVRQRFPAYDQWRLVRLGRYIGHLDFLAIFQWLSGAFARISLAIYLIVEALGIKKRITRHTFIAGTSLAILLLAFYPMTDIQFTHFMKMYLPISLIVIAAIVLTIYALCLSSKTRSP
jgi:hypothetical protein